MQIELTNVKDSGSISIDDTTASKLYLMEEIMKIFMPLFSTEIDRKQQQLESNKRDYRSLLDKVTKTKNQLSTIDEDVKKEKLIALILNQMKLLIDADVIYGDTKIKVLEIFESLPTSDIKSLKVHLNHVKKLVQKSKQSKP
jgi:hypothetical protein